MIFLRDGFLDVAIVPSPWIWEWPSVGATTLAYECANMGLEAGIFGQGGLQVRGVWPLPSTGAVVFAEDAQKRMHRYFVRSVVKFSKKPVFPAFFQGWEERALIPLEVFEYLKGKAFSVLGKRFLFLGSGNRVLTSAIDALEKGALEVHLLEEGDVLRGWEVKRRCFQMLGGKIWWGTLESLSEKAPLEWEVVLNDFYQEKISFPVFLVISGGPFSKEAPLKEERVGALVFEMPQTALLEKEQDRQGWYLEYARSKQLAYQIGRALLPFYGGFRKKLFQNKKEAQKKFQRLFAFQKHQFLYRYEGKWLSERTKKKIKHFPGVPDHALHWVASVECFEPIECDICAQVCPEKAIHVELKSQRKLYLKQSLCTGCGVCALSCPTQSILLLKESTGTQACLAFSYAKTFLPNHDFPQNGKLLNRKAQVLVPVRVAFFHAPLRANHSYEKLNHLPSKWFEWVQRRRHERFLLEVKVPSALLLEARALSFEKSSNVSLEEPTLNIENESDVKAVREVSFLLEGKKRKVPFGMTILEAMFFLGSWRSQDRLCCPDGSCGLCTFLVQGKRVLGCQTQVKSGMEIAFLNDPFFKKNMVCSCEGVLKENVDDFLEGSFEGSREESGVFSIGKGRCHGLYCERACAEYFLKRTQKPLLTQSGSFPWVDWVLSAKKKKEKDL